MNLQIGVLFIFLWVAPVHAQITELSALGHMPADSRLVIQTNTNILPNSTKTLIGHLPNIAGALDGNGECWLYHRAAANDRMLQTNQTFYLRLAVTNSWSIKADGTFFEQTRCAPQATDCEPVYVGNVFSIALFNEPTTVAQPVKSLYDPVKHITATGLITCTYDGRSMAHPTIRDFGLALQNLGKIELATTTGEN